jgi:hypothetical protein
MLLLDKLPVARSTRLVLRDIGGLGLTLVARWQDLIGLPCQRCEFIGV